jgi:hypothetical protein
MSEPNDNHEAAPERAKAAAALMAVVERLAARHLDETVEPEQYQIALRALAEGGPDLSGPDQ